MPKPREMSPGGSVVIVLPTGETRTVSMDTVRYAGRKEEAPKKATPTGAPRKPAREAGREQVARRAARGEPRPISEPDRILVRLESDTPDLTFHLRTDQSVSDVSGFVHGTRGLARVSGTVTTDTFQGSARRRARRPSTAAPTSSV